MRSFTSLAQIESTRPQSCAIPQARRIASGVHSGTLLSVHQLFPLEVSLLGSPCVQHKGYPPLSDTEAVCSTLGKCRCEALVYIEVGVDEEETIPMLYKAQLDGTSLNESYFFEIDHVLGRRSCCRSIYTLEVHHIVRRSSCHQRGCISRSETI